MSSPLPTPVPTALEQAEKVIPTVIDDINQRIADARQKASVRKSIVLDSEFVKRAKSQAKRLFDRKSQILAAAASPPLSAPLLPPLPARPDPNGVHVTFQSPLAEQIDSYQQIIARNIDAIFKNCLETAQLQVKQELEKWLDRIQQEAELDV